MNIKNRKKWLIAAMLIIAALFAPIPFRYGQVLCESCYAPGQCKPCPKEGDIGWGPSIGKRIWWKITKPEIELTE